MIAWHRTWIAAKGFGNIGETSIYEPGIGMVRMRCRVLTMEVRIARKYFRRLQLIHIPEFAIEDAMKELSANAGFKRRLLSRNLNHNDVNEIIRIASDGIVLLELDT